jgi:hypothetical protein
MTTRQTTSSWFDRKEGAVRYEIENGDYVGAVEWEGPGRVKLEMPEGPQKRWLEDYFRSEDSVMAAAGDHDGMTFERRDESEAAFNRAAYQLAAYSYKVHQGDDRRRAAHRQRTS